MLCKNNLSVKSCAHLFLALLFVTGCATVKQKEESVLAVVNGKQIKEKDLIAAMPDKDRKIYLTFKKQHVDRIVAKTLLEQEAERRKVSLRDLLNKEIFEQSKVSHDEIHSFYKKNKKKYKTNKVKDWKKEVELELKAKKEEARTRKLLRDIAGNTSIEYFFKAPDKFEKPNKTEKEAKGKPKDS